MVTSTAFSLWNWMPPVVSTRPPTGIWKAMAAGSMKVRRTVVRAGWAGGLGYLVVVDHGNGYMTYYGHNSSIVVSVGDHVYQGQQVARMGSTGISSGNHCHFGILKNNTFVNPLNYL